MLIKQNVIKNLILSSQAIENFLTSNQLQLIGDESDQNLLQCYNQKKTQIKLLKEQQYIEPDHLKELEEDEKKDSHQRLLSQICVIIKPEDPRKIFWDLIGMMFIFIQMISIPLILTFNLDVTGPWGVFSHVMDYYFIADMIVQFSTGYFHNGNYVGSRKRIVLNYLKLWFWLDLITSFPYDDVLSLSMSDTSQAEMQRNAQIIKIMRIIRFVKIIRLMRALKLKKILNQIEDSLLLDRSITNLIQFFKICLIILCLSHWLACVWNAIRIVEQNDMNWYSEYVLKYNQDDDSTNWFNSYVAGVYFSITTMITIGYGDISAQNTIERVFSIFVMILASGVFGYAMNSIVSLFQNTNESLEEVLNHNDAAIVYMKQKKINKSLQARIKNYLEWLAEDEQLQKSYAQNTLNKLSLPLRNQVTLLVHGKMMNQMRVLRKNFSSFLLKKLAFCFIEEIYNPEEWIINQNDPIDDSTSIYFILNGRVSICYPKTRGTIGLKELSKKEYFGEISFFGNVPRSASAKAQNFINIFRLSRKAFIEQATQEDMERFFAFKFQIEFEQNYEHLYIQCFLCQAKNHTAKQCPKSHYVINKYDRIDIIERYNEGIKQQVNNRRLRKQKTRTFKWMISQPNQKAIQEIQSDDYNLQKYLNTSQTIHIRKLYIKDSFNCDTVKEYTNFTPYSNLASIARLQNYNAEMYAENVRQIKAEMKKSKLKSKFVAFLQNKNEKRQPQQNKFSNLIFDIRKMQQEQHQQEQQDQISNRKKILRTQRTQRFEILPQAEDVRVGKDNRKLTRMSTRLKRMPRKTFLGELQIKPIVDVEDFDLITEDVSESPAQNLKQSKEIKIHTKSFNESNVKTFQIPEIQISTSHRRSSSVTLPQENFQKYSKQFLENMVYLVINHKMQNVIEK